MLSGNAPPIVCGIGDYTTRLAEELRHQGISVSLWTRAQAGVQESATVRTPASQLSDAGIAAFVAQLAKERPVILHLQYEADTYNDNGLALLRFAVATRKLGIRLVTTFHALDGPRPWGKAHRLALIAGILGSRDIVICSKRQYEALAKLPTIRRKTHLIPVGSAIPVTGKRSRKRQEAVLQLVYFGFVWRGRNIETCVRALAAVNNQMPATLIIAGSIKDEAYKQEVEALARSLGVLEQVNFTGDLPAVALSQILADADITLLPFHTGVSTGRTTFVAALEHGVPTVTMATADNVIPEFQNNINLVYVSPDDTEGFIQATLRLATDIMLREQISANIPTLARYFSWQEIARKTANLPSYRKQ